MSHSDAPIWQNAEVGRHFLEGVRGGIPLAAEQIRVMLLLLRHAQPKLRSFLDLGCGDGILGRAVLTQYPQAAGVFLDFSESMIAAARQKVPAQDCHVTFLLQDYGRPDWAESVRAHAPFDAIVSGFSIHHQPDVRKRALYRELFELLSVGGMFLNLEHVASPTPWIEAVHDRSFVEAVVEFQMRADPAKTRSDIEQEYFHRPDKAANILAPVEEQCQWLREIGFQ